MIENNINYFGQYSFIEHVKRFFSPCYKNAQDLKTANVAVNRLEQVINDLTRESRELTPELQQELTNCDHLVKRLSKQRFVNKEVLQIRYILEYYLVAEKIARAQEIPFKILAENFELIGFITSNHLHHKITPQHRQEGYGILADHEGILRFSFPLNGQRNFLTFEELKQHFSQSYDPIYGRIKDLEFMANGLEIHSAKKWEHIRSTYSMTNENGIYVHIDTLTGEKEEVGPVGDDFVQLVNVYPWGWNPKGGSLFGHTYIRFIVEGKLYHVGMNVKGEILNPDFMSCMSMEGKKFKTSQWKVMDKEVDEHGHNQAQRTLIKLELMQAQLNNRDAAEEAAPYAEETKQLYSDIRNKKGGTCTAGALAFLKQFDDEVNEERSRNIFSRIILNSVTKRILDFTWGLFPNCMRKRVIQPIQVITRAAKPANV